MLAIGRGLMTNPDCLIMDEPSEGLAPIIIQGVWEAIGKLKEEGLSILLVEQNASLALKLVDYVHVMSKGQVVYSRAGRRSCGPTTNQVAAISAFDIVQASLTSQRTIDEQGLRTMAQTLEQVRGDRGTQARQAGARDPAEEHDRRHSFACRDCAGRRASPSRISIMSTIPLAHFANAETKALSQKQEEDIRSRITGYDERLADLDAMGIDIQLVMPPPQPVLLHGAARHRGAGLAHGQRRHSPNTSRASPTGSWRSAPCR